MVSLFNCFVAPLGTLFFEVGDDEAVVSLIFGVIIRKLFLAKHFIVLSKRGIQLFYTMLQIFNKWLALKVFLPSSFLSTLS